MNNNVNNNLVSNSNPANTTIQQVVTPIQSNVKATKNNNKIYIWIGVIVGIALLVAFILLGFLLSGAIANRNKLTCTITTPESGYNYTIERLYSFDNGIMQRLDLTYTFSYNNTFTEDMYNETFGEIIRNEKRGSTKYGLGTKISKSGNIVTITAFEPSYWNEAYKTVKNTNKSEGYTCK